MKPDRVLVSITALLIALAPLAAQPSPSYQAIFRVPLSGRASLGQLIQDENSPAEARRNAMRRLRQLSNEAGAEKIAASEFYQPLLQALRLPGKDNATLRETACEELGWFGAQSGGAVAGGLARVLENNNEAIEVRIAAARSLGSMSGAAAGASSSLVGQLRAEMRSGPNANNIPLVRTLVDSLGKLSQAGARSTLLGILDSRFPDDVKRSARKALEKLPVGKN